jgi:hypothetical protein
MIIRDRCDKASAISSWLASVFGDARAADAAQPAGQASGVMLLDLGLRAGIEERPRAG